MKDTTKTRIFCIYCRRVTLHRLFSKEPGRIKKWSCEVCGTIAERSGRQELVFDRLLQEGGSRE